MKNLFILLIFINLSFASSESNVDERKLDIYFGNGLFNDKITANSYRKKLKELLEYSFISKDPYLNKHINFHTSHNWDKGLAQDSLELIYQLSENGQLDLNTTGYFELMSEVLGVSTPVIVGITVLSELYDLVRENRIKTIEQENIDEMLNNYKSTSFQKGHRVLLVTHSQGGIFANKVYSKLDGYQDYFNNIHVGSVASSVANGDAFVTLKSDLAVKLSNGLIGDLNNTNGAEGHGFLTAYLAGDNSSQLISSLAKSHINRLKDKESQWVVKSEDNEDSCQHRLKLTHDFDTTLDDEIEDVYPFDKDSGLVYKVENNRTNEQEYIKGDKKGEVIGSHIDFINVATNKCHDINSSVCYKLTKTNQEIDMDIEKPRYEIIHEYNKGTCNYRVLLKDLYAGWVYDNVYPFSKSASYVYDVLDNNGDTSKVSSSSCKGTDIKLTIPEYECYELNNTSEKIYQDLTITKTEVINECKTERITGSKGYSYWEDFCDYSVVINDWIKSEWDWVDDSLKPCEFPKEDGVSFSKEIPEGYSLKEESMSESNTAKLVYDSTNENAVDVAYIVGQARCYSSLLRGSSSSIKYQATVNKGYETSSITSQVWEKSN